MKIFKLTILLLCAFASEANAQNNAPKKEVVIIGQFSRARQVPSNFSQTIRNNVIVGFVAKGRFSVVDAQTDAKLKELNANRPLMEDEVDENNVMDATHSAAYKSIGAKYIILGDATQHTNTREVSSEGRVSYIAKIYLTLKGFDITTGEAIAATQLTLSGYSSRSRQDADAKATGDVKGKINSYIDKNFKFQTKILQLDEVKKGKLKTLYINAGSEVGTKKSDTFVVYKIVNVAGMESKKEIGKLRATTVNNAQLSLCKVTKGAAEIYDEFQKGSELIVESLGKGGFGGFLEKADNLL